MEIPPFKNPDPVSRLLCQRLQLENDVHLNEALINHYNDVDSRCTETGFLYNILKESNDRFAQTAHLVSETGKVLGASLSDIDQSATKMKERIDNLDRDAILWAQECRQKALPLCEKIPATLGIRSTFEKMKMTLLAEKEKQLRTSVELSEMEQEICKANKELEDEIAELVEQASVDEKEIEKCEAAVASNREKTSKVSEDISKVEKAMAEDSQLESSLIEGERQDDCAIEEENKTMETLKTELSSVEEEVKNVCHDDELLETDCTNIETELSEITVENVHEDIGKVITSTDLEIEDLKKEISICPKQLDTSISAEKLATDVEDLENELNVLKSHGKEEIEKLDAKYEEQLTTKKELDSQLSFEMIELGQCEKKIISSFSEVQARRERSSVELQKYTEVANMETLILDQERNKVDEIRKQMLDPMFSTPKSNISFTPKKLAVTTAKKSVAEDDREDSSSGDEVSSNIPEVPGIEPFSPETLKKKKKAVKPPGVPRATSSKEDGQRFPSDIFLHDVLSSELTGAPSTQSAFASSHERDMNDTVDESDQSIWEM